MAVILSAGIGSRFNLLTEKVPKCLLKVDSKSILEIQLDNIFALPEIDKVFFVVGHEYGQIEAFVERSQFSKKIELVLNQDFLKTNNMYSLNLVSPRLSGKKFLLCNGDVAFTIKSLQRFTKEDSSEIIFERNIYREDSMKMILDSTGNLERITKDINELLSDGISMDVYKFNSEDSRILFDHIQLQVDEGTINLWTEVAIDSLCQMGKLTMRGVENVGDPWFEIDNTNDLVSARKIFVDRHSFYSIENYFFDLDVNLLIEDEPIVGSRERISYLNSLRKSVFFLTNNSGYSDKQHFERLSQKGFLLENFQIINALNQTIRHLSQMGVKKVFFLGTGSASRDFEKSGMNLNTDFPEIVVLGNVTEITYKKIERALTHIYQGVPYVLTHADVSRPTLKG